MALRPGIFLSALVALLSFIRMGIADKNDNAPYFDKALYEAEVDENEDIQHTVLTVTAEDEDESSRIRYEITRGNFGGAFAVKNMTGAIYVAGPLDYETRKRYELRLVASDNVNENYTKIVIHVNNVNDNPPVFDRPTYVVNITEETVYVDAPLIQVKANDGDKDRPHNIVYFLTGQGVNPDHPDQSMFDINSTTGEIFALKPLDLDEPSGRTQWRFTVFAQDEGGIGLVGYADVQVNLKDINDATECADWQHFCKESKECQSRSRSCAGQCPEGRRYCPRYLIDDFIGDGKGSCVREDQPCGEECIDGKEFCLASNSCLSDMTQCECPEGRWPATDGTVRADCGQELGKCSLFANQTLPSTIRECYVPVSRSGSDGGSGFGKLTRVRGGQCHPSYVFCQETQACTPLLYTSCGYWDWVRAFWLRGCVQMRSDWQHMADCARDLMSCDTENGGCREVIGKLIIESNARYFGKK